MREEISQEYSTKNPTYQAKKEYLQNEMEEVDVVDSFEQSLKKGRKEKKIQYID